MSEHMIPKMKTVNMYQKATQGSTTPDHIELLSPGIDGSYTMLTSTTSMTPEKITLKREPPEIIKVPKTGHGGNIAGTKQSD